MSNIGFSWRCPYCGQATTITGPNISNSWIKIDTQRSLHGRIALLHKATACPNPECNQLELSVQLCNTDEYGHELTDSIQKWNLLPESNAKPQPEYIPEAILKNYYQACRIRDLSPEASAALSRRCLQGMIRDFWELPENQRGNLGAEINAIKDKLAPEVLQAIWDVRAIGDIGAHMDKDVNRIVEVEPEEAGLLIELIETLLRDWYVDRHKRRERLASLRSTVEEKRQQQKANKEAKKSEESHAEESRLGTLIGQSDS